MTFLSKQTASNGKQFFDLTRQADEDLHCLLDSVTNEMARRASVNAKRRALVRRLEVLAESEGVTLDEVRLYLKGDHRVPESKPKEQEVLAKVEPEVSADMPVDRKSDVSLDKQFENMLQRGLADFS